MKLLAVKFCVDVDLNVLTMLFVDFGVLRKGSEMVELSLKDEKRNF